MTPYDLAKLVDWAGVLNARKRLQKVVYLLRAAGCTAFDADFILHHYGPYSPEVASLTDQMVANGLLEEQAEPNQVGVSYSYKLTQRARHSMQAMEESEWGEALASMLQPFKPVATRLLHADLRDLEYAATLVYFHGQTNDWDEAVKKTCSFKKLQTDGEAIRRATVIARGIVN